MPRVNLGKFNTLADRDAAISRLWLAGASGSQIAQEVGIPTYNVYNRSKQLQLPGRVAGGKKGSRKPPCAPMAVTAATTVRSSSPEPKVPARSPAPVPAPRSYLFWTPPKSLLMGGK